MPQSIIPAKQKQVASIKSNHLKFLFQPKSEKLKLKIFITNVIIVMEIMQDIVKNTCGAHQNENLKKKKGIEVNITGRKTIGEKNKILTSLFMIFLYYFH
jgi:hypothetical protein